MAPYDHPFQSCCMSLEPPAARWNWYLTSPVVVQVSFPCGACSSSSCGILTTASGRLTDGPSKYATNGFCQWLIAPADATTITIQLIQFDTEGGWDFMTLSSCTDVSCETKQQLMRHSGSLPVLRSYTSLTGFLLVEFTSDTINPDEGFTAAWNSDVSAPWLVFDLLTK